MRLFKRVNGGREGRRATNTAHLRAPAFSPTRRTFLSCGEALGILIRSARLPQLVRLPYICAAAVSGAHLYSRSAFPSISHLPRHAPTGMRLRHARCDSDTAAARATLPWASHPSPNYCPAVCLMPTTGVSLSAVRPGTCLSRPGPALACRWETPGPRHRPGPGVARPVRASSHWLGARSSMESDGDQSGVTGRRQRASGPSRDSADGPGRPPA